MIELGITCQEEQIEQETIDQENKNKISTSETILKVIIWRVIATSISITVAYITTGSVSDAIKIGIADNIIKIVAHFILERSWIRIWSVCAPI